jgi:hypothetical protein
VDINAVCVERQRLSDCRLCAIFNYADCFNDFDFITVPPWTGRDESPSIDELDSHMYAAAARHITGPLVAGGNCDVADRIMQRCINTSWILNGHLPLDGCPQRPVERSKNSPTKYQAREHARIACISARLPFRHGDMGHA